jgi:hypothetical protein
MMEKQKMRTPTPFNLKILIFDEPAALVCWQRPRFVPLNSTVHVIGHAAKQKAKTRAYSTCDSPVVPHRSTEHA